VRFGWEGEEVVVGSALGRTGDRAKAGRVAASQELERQPYSQNETWETAVGDEFTCLARPIRTSIKPVSS
jgi:hypothetical protein